MKSCYWKISALVTGMGIALVALTFDQALRWTLVGLTLILLGAAVANLGCSAHRSRSLEVEFEAGYRAGLRAGRRAPSMRLVNISDWREERGGISQAPLGSMASHSSTAGRSAQDAHGPAQGGREVLGRGLRGRYSPRGVG